MRTSAAAAVAAAVFAAAGSSRLASMPRDVVGTASRMGHPVAPTEPSSAPAVVRPTNLSATAPTGGTAPTRIVCGGTHPFP